MNKRCSKCGEVKDVVEFYKAKYGYQGQCKICRNIIIKEYADKHKKEKAMRGNIYYEENRKELLIQHKKYNGTHKKEKIEYDKNHFKKHKEEINERHKEYNKKNKEKGAEYRKIYFKKNKRKIIARHNQWAMGKRKDDINYKIKGNLCNRMVQALQRKSKSMTTMKLIGCTIEELKQHLESQFIEDMTFDNYGYYGWHIDHIKPCVLFDLSDPEQQKQCFHYTNLQPLWAKDNLSKGAKYEEVV